jgi:hypothetical protein
MLLGSRHNGGGPGYGVISRPRHRARVASLVTTRIVLCDDHGRSARGVNYFTHLKQRAQNWICAFRRIRTLILYLLVASALRFRVTTAHLFNVDLLDAVVGLLRRCWGLPAALWAAIYRGWGMNRFVASCLASGAVAHWLILLFALAYS